MFSTESERTNLAEENFVIVNYITRLQGNKKSEHTVKINDKLAHFTKTWLVLRRTREQSLELVAKTVTS